jgi:hypothetical protein
VQATGNRAMSQKKEKQRRRERREIQAALAEQLRLLAKRCRDFDEGDWGEAVGMATRLRVILNPGGKGTPSILQSLGAKKVPLLSTCEPIEDSDNVLEALGGLYRQRFAKDENGVFYELTPKLGDTDYRAEFPATRWWEHIVSIVDSGGGRHVYRRKDVVADIANKDGGAHLADSIPESYDVMSRPGGIIRVTIGSEGATEEVPIAGVHLAMLRQIAYEVLNSPALVALTDPANDGKVPVSSPGSTGSQEGKSTGAWREKADLDPLRDKIARYFAAYYQEARSQLSGRSFSIETVPSHLMPWRKLVRTWETKDGHFVVEHISSPTASSWLGYQPPRFDSYEYYLHLNPRRDQTLEEMTGVRVEENASVLMADVRGKRIGDAGYEEVQNGDFMERVDAISRNKVPELTEESAREAAQADMQPYLGLE